MYIFQSFLKTNSLPDFDLMYIFEALSYFGNLFTVSVLFVLFGGFNWISNWCIPGLSPPMAIALLIPFLLIFHQLKL